MDSLNFIPFRMSYQAGPGPRFTKEAYWSRQNTFKVIMEIFLIPHKRVRITHTSIDLREEANTHHLDDKDYVRASVAWRREVFEYTGTLGSFDFPASRVRNRSLGPGNYEHQARFCMTLKPFIGPERIFQDYNWLRRGLYKIEVEIYFQPRPQVRVYRHLTNGEDDLRTTIDYEVDVEWDETLRLCVL